MSNVPMTRPDLVLATHEERLGTNNTMIDMGQGRILRVTAGWSFIRSEDGGITWGEPQEYKDPDGERVGGSGISLVKLAGAVTSGYHPYE